jgi:hypothetical protein
MNKAQLTQALQARLDTVWGIYCDINKRLIGFQKPTIVLNGRLSKTAGRCFMESNHIDIGTKFLMAHYDQVMAETVPHEIAHQIDYNLYGIPAGNRWHGKTWQNIMLQLGVKPDTYHDMVV